MSGSNESKNQICPQCAELNPGEAVMCWACYSPLGSSPTPRPSSASIWREKVSAALRFVVLGALISSGWWRGKTRFGVLGAALSVVALEFAWEKATERARNQKQSTDAPRRIADTLLLYALRDNAAQVKIFQNEHGLLVQYHIDDEWHEQMKLPHYVWDSLQREFSERAQNGAVKISPTASRQDELMDPPTSEEADATFTLELTGDSPRGQILLTRI